LPGLLLLLLRPQFRTELFEHRFLSRRLLLLLLLLP
jgi:hypothetical protein